MTPFRFGDVVLVPFPFTDQSSTKKRPAVVVSSEAYHAERSDLILAAVTSQAASNRFGEVTIGAWQRAGLLKPSVVKPVLTTLEPRLVERTLGRLESSDRSSLRSALDVIVGR